MPVTNMPLILNLFHNYDFIFENNFVFTDQFMDLLRNSGVS